MLFDIPKIDYHILCDENHINKQLELEKLKIAVTEYGFLIIKNHPIKSKNIMNIFSIYKQFFNQSIKDKNKANMSNTSSNRGWGGLRAEKVNKNFNFDYKEIFDCGPNINFKHKFEELTYYSKNIWPEQIPLFEKTIMSFYKSCEIISLSILKQIEISLNYSSNYFADKFNIPMSLLRCNYYPQRSQELSNKDFGIATHTDYGCLTLLFTNGTPGLEIELASKKWGEIIAKKNEIIVNFGDMLEIWSNKKIKATPHRVKVSNKERYSIPFFFNPQYDTIISEENKILAGQYLSEKYNSTYVHKIA